ncbi:hypothetical protein EYF80_021232 [Liparis tanakae]|uniref:Uncharacterized protein n=1 Tax=Liparis tanakae TaxID=230148 RepID=A0A4Z2HRX0_9TELE|nr:hypothetical protein EYF80_021232 [Liparis tanakae]
MKEKLSVEKGGRGLTLAPLAAVGVQRVCYLLCKVRVPREFAEMHELQMQRAVLGQDAAAARSPGPVSANTAGPGQKEETRGFNKTDKQLLNVSQSERMDLHPPPPDAAWRDDEAAATLPPYLARGQTDEKPWRGNTANEAAEWTDGTVCRKMEKILGHSRLSRAQGMPVGVLKAGSSFSPSSTAFLRFCVSHVSGQLRGLVALAVNVKYFHVCLPGATGFGQRGNGPFLSVPTRLDSNRSPLKDAMSVQLLCRPHVGGRLISLHH